MHDIIEGYPSHMRNAWLIANKKKSYAKTRNYGRTFIK